MLDYSNRLSVTVVVPKDDSTLRVEYSFGFRNKVHCITKYCSNQFSEGFFDEDAELIPLHLSSRNDF
jgi:hypothetical protein